MISRLSHFFRLKRSTNMEEILAVTLYRYLKLKILALTSFCLWTTCAFSQPYQNLSQDQKLELSTKLVKETPLIFEGELIDFKAFKGDDNRIYTTVHVRTIHSYKGSIPIEEEIKIIKRGGYLNGEYVADKHSIGLDDFLAKKTKFIFFCKENINLPVPPKGTTEQYCQFQIDEFSSVIGDMSYSYGTEGWVGLYWLIFKNRMEMDDFLGEFEGLSIPQRPKKD